MAHTSLPPFISKYFWGDDLHTLDLENHKTYIIQTILEKGDREAVRWLFATISVSTVKETVPKIRLSKKSAHFWNIYLS